jgi:hypothetical protein
MPVIILCTIASSIDAEKIEVAATTTLVDKYANEAVVAPVVTFGGVWSKAVSFVLVRFAGIWILSS